MDTICFKNINWLSEFGIINLKEYNESNIKNLLPESLTINCFSCGIKFTSFLNRPNLCIICLNLFCNSCITKIKFKFCKNCLKLCQKFSQIISKSLILIEEKKKSFLEMKEAFYSKAYDDSQTSCQDFILNENKDFETKLLVNMNDTYELIMKTLINYVLKINFDDENIITEWKNIIYILLKETISNLHPSSRNLNDSLDINNYIKIKIIPYKDTSLCQVIQGYVLHKKKKIKNIKNNIYNPKILLLNQEIDFNENDEKKNNSNNINNSQDIQMHILKLIENKIDMVRPDIVIIGKEFPKEIVDILINNNNFNNISIIYDINNKVIKKLSRCLQTLILPSLNLIGSNSILGSCKRFYIQNYSNIDKRQNEEEKNNKSEDTNDISNNENENDNDLFIFDGCDRLLFCTIILSGYDLDLLKKIKRLLRQILIPSIRDLYLQKYIQYTLNMEINPVPEENEIEIDFIEELYEESREIISLKLDGTFSNKTEKKKERLSAQQLLKLSSQKTDITQLFYEGFDLSIIEKKEDFNIYSIISLTSSQKNKVEVKNNLNEEKDEEISEKEIHNIVNKYCEASKELNLSFFNGNTDYDLPLGKFILDLCNRSNIVCPTCHLEYKKHTQYLYRAKGVLKIWMISRNEYNLDKIINYLNQKTRIDYSKIISYKNNICSKIDIQNANIYTYGYCNICNGIVTPLFKMSDEVFNYSSSKFLRFLLENHLSKNQIRTSNFNISNLIVNKNCEHQINKNISRIFVTRFGSWIFEYNDIIKHNISPMNLNINDTFSNHILFKKYEEEGYSNSINSLTLIKKALSSQEKFLKELLEDNKLFLFIKCINSIISIIQSMHNFIEQFLIDIVNKYLKYEIDKYENSYVRLIAYIKKIYLKIVKVKLIVNRIERMKVNMKVISDILNNQIPLTFEENNKLLENIDKEKSNDSSNKLIYLNSEINFRKDSSFRNILTFLNYSDDKHDYFSCEFIQDDLASFIGNIISSNEYIKYMKLKNGLNLTSIKSKRNSNEMLNSEISRSLFKKRRFSSFKQMQEKNNFFGEIEKGISRRMSLDEFKDDTSDLYDTMLVFDPSKQQFYVNGDKAATYSNKLIKKILEEEIISGEKDHKNFLLTNDLYSLLIKKKKKEESNKIQKITISENSLNISNSSSNNNISIVNEDSKDKNITSDNINKNDIDENENNEKSALNKITSKKDFKKINLYFKEIENEIYESNILFKELRDRLIDIIKNKIENSEKKEITESKQNENNDEGTQKNNPKDKDNKENEISNLDNIKDNNNIDKIEDNNGFDTKKMIDNNVSSNNDTNKNEDEINKVEIEKNPEENIPLFPIVPEFEKISQMKFQVFFEEKLILKDPNQIEIIIYYAKQFEALRIVYCSTIEDFLISLSKSGEWFENTGGKSKASFYKTFDERFIIKNVSENEFNMFLDNGLEYFQYISRFLFHKMPSALAKILGAYKIIIKKKNREIKYHLILMENIYYGTISNISKPFNSPESNIKVYDLKGSNINRYIKKNMRKPGQVLLDTNFLVDFNKEPVFIDSYAYDRLKIALYNDSNYLRKLEVVDYSLLIIFENKGNNKNEDYHDKYLFLEKENNNRLIKLGIIDYIRKYTWDKKMEFYGKSLIYRENPTIVEPTVYSDRFYKSISKYFVGI